jgi:hypothetical protein
VELKDQRGYLPMATGGSRISLPPDSALRAHYGAAGHDRNAAGQVSML